MWHFQGLLWSEAYYLMSSVVELLFRNNLLHCLPLCTWSNAGK